MKATPKVELLIDVLHPVEETVNVITYMLSLHPDRQYELLQQIDMQIGEALAALDEAHKKSADSKVAEDLESPVE